MSRDFVLLHTKLDMVNIPDLHVNYLKYLWWHWVTASIEKCCCLRDDGFSQGYFIPCILEFLMQIQDIVLLLLQEPVLQLLDVQGDADHLLLLLLLHCFIFWPLDNNWLSKINSRNSHLWLLSTSILALAHCFCFFQSLSFFQSWIRHAKKSKY